MYVRRFRRLMDAKSPRIPWKPLKTDSVTMQPVPHVDIHAVVQAFIKAACFGSYLSPKK
jgi:hypothetical protein